MNDYKKRVGVAKNQDYAQSKVTMVLPILMDTVTQQSDGKFVFAHAKFPEMKVEGVTLSFVQEELERVLKRLLRNQSNAHIDYVCKLLISSK